MRVLNKVTRIDTDVINPQIAYYDVTLGRCPEVSW